MNLSVGIVGCGKHAHNHAGIICKSDFAKLTACADISNQQADAFARKYGCENSYGSLEEMISSHPLDLLIIVALPTVHPQLISEAINSGIRAIICEKPLALNKDQAHEIQLLATKNDVLVVEGLMYRSHPQIRKTKELLELGRIGDVKYIHGQFSDYSNFNPDNWRTQRALGGGSMTAKGCYLVDACNYFSGSRATGAFCVESIDPDFNVEVGQTGTIVYENGVTAQFETNHRSVWREELKICGTKGSIIIPHAIVTKTQKRFIEIQSNGSYEGRPMEIERIEFDACNSYELQFNNVYRYLKQQDSLSMPIADSVMNYCVTDALMKSVKTGKLEAVFCEWV